MLRSSRSIGCFTLLIAVALLSASVYLKDTSVRSLRVASFNIQVFGQSKMEKAGIKEILVDIIRRYDLVFVQEIRDSAKQTAIHHFLEELNQDLPDRDRYEVLTSEPLGRTSSKEQYGWIYRPRLVSIEKDLVVPDKLDHFERPPHIVWWRVKSSGYRLVTMGLHARPKLQDALIELEWLSKAHDKHVRPSKHDGSLIMGDFNLGLSTTKWDCLQDPKCKAVQLSLWNPNKYKWLVGNDVDTTVGRDQKAYDRIIATGDLRRPGRVTDGSVQAFNFRDEYALDQDTTKMVSDHFPVELTVNLGVASGGNFWFLLPLGAITLTMSMTILWCSTRKSPNGAGDLESGGWPPARSVELSAAANEPLAGGRPNGPPFAGRHSLPARCSDVASRECWRPSGAGVGAGARAHAGSADSWWSPVEPRSMKMAAAAASLQSGAQEQPRRFHIPGRRLRRALFGQRHSSG
eukprot:TRINITY_DN26858_c0_g1_i1.p1 TRINITY_DN26858_c0_g1~~TRINITY_DN26858_c0_g1_i1.p1  ORF type:complete len:461 (-),score=89.39 TRINITY_DN26858_c0_g1_i1:93-1475(-)